jgi:hypothetical protein
MEDSKPHRARAKRVIGGSLILAFLVACSSAETSGLPGDGGSGGAVSAGGTVGQPGAGGAITSAGGQPAAGGAITSAGGTVEQPGAGGSEPTGSGGEPTSGVGGTGGSETQPGAGGAETEPGAGGGSGGGVSDIKVVLAGDNIDQNGPLATTVEDLSFSGGGHILVRPTNITNEPNAKHPVAIWGPGGGTPPRDYLQLLTRMASQGFVIVGIRESTGDAVLMSAAIDWLEDQNEDPNSPMYDRLILNRVGVFGHSMGGLSSEATALVDKRVTTALLDNSGSFSHDALVNITMPVGIIYGETGQEAPNAEGDYNNPGNKGPVWISKMKGGGHGSGPWDGASANVAWMRWHIGGENSRKNDFLGQGGRFNNTGIWETKFKNWDGFKNWNE